MRRQMATRLRPQTMFQLFPLLLLLILVDALPQQHAPPPPPGGNQINVPIYTVASPFDYESIKLALYHEYIELDLFHNGLARFRVEDFEAAGLDAEDRYLIEYMADQEVGHAIALTN